MTVPDILQWLHGSLGGHVTIVATILLLCLIGGTVDVIRPDND